MSPVTRMPIGVRLSQNGRLGHRCGLLICERLTQSATQIANIAIPCVDHAINNEWPPVILGYDHTAAKILHKFDHPDREDIRAWFTSASPG
jgi:hypothetical protein